MDSNRPLDTAGSLGIAVPALFQPAAAKLIHVDIHRRDEHQGDQCGQGQTKGDDRRHGG